jgi:hypothetical protein
VTLVACMQYTQTLLQTVTWPAAMLALPSPPGALQVNLTPPNPNVIASAPTASVWFLRGMESRDQDRLRVGTIPRASYAGGPSGTKGVEHTIAVYIAWEGTSATDPNQDILFPGMLDAIRAVLRVSADPVVVTDPWTGDQSYIVDVGEVIEYSTDLEALAPQRLNRWDGLLTCPVVEVFSS